MTPLRFGAPARRLFGLYQPPSAGMGTAHCVVLCNPFGQEAIRSHRLLRVLGDRLARAGFTVLRFDYSGTGDSDGDDSEADLGRWVEDVVSADAEARRASGLRTSSWFGVRLGATLAALASAQAPSPPRTLVLWDPVADGRAYLDELAAAHREALRIAEPRSLVAAGAGGREALGFPIPGALEAQLLALSPASFAMACAAQVSVISSAQAPGTEALRAAMGGVGSTSETRIASQIAWATDEAMGSAIVPTDALEAIAAALARPA